MFLLRLVLIIPMLLCAVASAAASADNVRIGVLAKRGAEQALSQWQPTAEYLSEKVTGHHFEIVPLDFAAIGPAVAEGRVDFVLANSAIYVEFEKLYGASRIATLRNIDHGGGYTQFGGVIFTRSDRDDINSLKSIVGKRFAAVESNSLGGFLMGWRELASAGINPYEDTQLSFVGTHDAVVYAVLDGIADAGTVRTDTLERMAEEGKVDLARIKVINPQHYPNFEYLISTRLYPEWPIAKLKHTSEELSHDVATALLEMPPDCCAAKQAHIVGWTVPRNYQPVHDLMRELHVGPYADLGKITLEQLIAQYWHWLLLTLLLILVMLAVILYIGALNLRLRTTEAKLVDARDHLTERVRERTAELEASRAQLERISRDWNDAFDAIDDPIFIHDAEMRIVQANPAYCQRAGVELDALLGERYFDYFPRLAGPLPACLDFPEALHTQGDELTLENGDIYISRSFGIRHGGGRVAHAIHILEDVTAEHNAKAQLTNRIALEAMLANLASRFVAVEPEGLNTALNESLAGLGKFSGADRVYLFHYEASDDSISNTHEWCAEGIKSEQQLLQQLPFDTFPWLKQKLLQGEGVVVDDTSLLPPEAEAERAEFERESIRSLLLAPISYAGRFVGFLGFDFVSTQHSWAEVDVRVLRTAGELIANTIGRISAVEKVREREASLAAAQHIAHLGNWDWNIVTGELEWSDEIYRIFGLAPHQFGATYEAFLETVHPDDRNHVIDNVNRAVAGEVDYEIDHRIVLPDGQIRVVHEKGDVACDTGGKPLCMIGTVQDVTEVRRGELELRRLNRALRTLSRCNTILVHAQDEDALLEAICKALIDTGGYRFAWVGYSQMDVGKSIRPVACAGQGKDFLQGLQASWADGAAGDLPPGYAIRQREPFIEHDIGTSRGSTAWRIAALAQGYASVIALPLISQGQLYGALTIDSAEADAFDENEVALLQELAGDLAFGILTLRNQQERHRAEQALQATEQRYEELYENAPNAYLSVDASDGQLLQFNRALCELLGYQRGELDGLRVFELYYDSEEGLAKAKQVFTRFKQGGTVRDVPLQMRRRSGEPIWVSVSVDPIFDDAGNVVESRSVVIDISERKQAEEEQHQAQQRLQRSLLQTIQAIALTIEKRDPYTAGHQERVAKLAVAIAEELGLEQERIEGLRLGALIHDIGKIAVPAEILNRPGELDPNLFAMIKIHPTIGYDIIHGIEFPWPLADMVVQHHERLDGSGYPKGLKGEDILLEARILAVADVVEAMATHRPYRPARGVEAALQELDVGKGRLYDAEVVESCQRLFLKQDQQWPLN